MEKTYVITRKQFESVNDFWTRLANEIRCMEVKIISMRVNVHCDNMSAEIVYCDL
jgi:hypothetical protein